MELKYHIIHCLNFPSDLVDFLSCESKIELLTSEGRLRRPASVSEKLPWLVFLLSVSSLELMEVRASLALMAPGDLWWPDTNLMSGELGEEYTPLSPTVKDSQVSASVKINLLVIATYRLFYLFKILPFFLKSIPLLLQFRIFRLLV